MVIKRIVFLLISVLVISCSSTDDVIDFDTLEEYITINDDKELDEVIACAASKNGELEVSYVFYYPIEEATNIQYFETENTSVSKEDFSSYTLVDLEKEDVFNGYLERFVRNGATECWCVVTYETAGKLHVSNPIRLKNASKPTEWSDKVTINTTTTLMPTFTWEDGEIQENEIYFQVLSNADNDFLTGTYTYDTWFQFYDLNNVVLNITTEENPELDKDETYNFTMMGVSEDNWVNLVIQKTFTTDE